MATKPIKPMTLSAKQRHALAVIAATDPDGAAQTLLTAHGLSDDRGAREGRSCSDWTREGAGRRQLDRRRQGADHGQRGALRSRGRSFAAKVDAPAFHSARCPKGG